MYKKYNRVLKIKITKKRREKKKEDERKKENSTELQELNVEAKVYNKNKKCDWQKKKNRYIKLNRGRWRFIYIKD